MARRPRIAPGVLLAAAALLAVVLGPGAARAAPNALDETFGEGGMRLNRDILGGLGKDNTAFQRLRLLPDGRMMVLATHRGASMETIDQVVARYTPRVRPRPDLGPRRLGVGHVPRSRARG